MTEDIEKLVESGEWSVGVRDLKFYVYNNGTGEALRDHKGKVRIFGSEVFADEIICPDVEDLDEIWKPDIKPAYDVDVVSEDLMWVGFKDYDIRIEKDPEFNDGHLQISVHSKKDDGYMLHQDGEPCKLIVREENENEEV